MGFSLSSTISTSGTTLAKTENESKFQQDPSSKVRDQATYDETTVADESTVFRSTPMQSLKKSLLCHAFWSLCFDEEEEDGISRKPEDQSTVVASLQGTALEEWQLQQKREKRAWLGLSFSDDVDAMRYEKMGTARKIDSSIAKTNQSSKDPSRAPETIMISRVKVADKYMLAGETMYEVADDVASEVSLDFTEPHKEIKGQRIQIKKKPPKVIKTTKPRGKKESSRVKYEVTNQVREEATVADTNSMLESSGQKTDNSELAESKANTKASLEAHNGSFLENQEKVVAEKKSDISSTKEETSKNASSNTKEEKSKGGKSKSKQNSDTVKRKKKSTKKTKSHTNTKSESPKVAQETSSEAAQDSETIDDSSVLPNPRFITDFSERELKLRAPDVSPETLRWKHAEESRWQYYGDPRQSRVDYWWKEKSRDVGSMRAVDAEARDPVIEGEYYVYDSDSDNESYFDKYVSGPSLPSPEEAQEQALKLASECNNSKTTVRFPFRRESKYDASDELNDFAEIHDLGRPRRHLRFFTASGGNESYEDQATKAAPEAKSIPQLATTARDSTVLQPVPPGVFKL
ncbi:MAG: hypothetical protein SGILL_000754 [Bacillariaceae sp.]